MADFMISLLALFLLCSIPSGVHPVVREMQGRLAWWAS